MIFGDILLTAAHCAEAFSPGQTVYLGGIRRSGTDAVTTVTVTEILPHPLYEVTNEVDHDFLLIKIDGDVSSSIAVPNWNVNPAVPADDETCLTMGFGLTEDFVESDDLLHVQLPVVNQDDCNIEYSGFITDAMVCAGGEVGRSSCFGDSGSPLMYNGEIVGVTSFGSFFCGDGLPTVRIF